MRNYFTGMTGEVGDQLELFRRESDFTTAHGHRVRIQIDTKVTHGDDARFLIVRREAAQVGADPGQ